MEPKYENVPAGVNELDWKSVMLSNEETERVRSLFKKITKIEAFEVEGIIFKGNSMRAAMDFVHNTVFPADFLVWLQNNYTQLK